MLAAIIPIIPKAIIPKVVFTVTLVLTPHMCYFLLNFTHFSLVGGNWDSGKHIITMLQNLAQDPCSEP